jgi:hypothetical protein
MFFGPPSDPSTDREAVRRFLAEKGEKIIIGGTTCSIFERELKTKSSIDLKTSGKNLMPYGFIDNIIVTEGTLTIRKLNDVFYEDYSSKDAVKLLKNKIIEHERIKIFHGKAVNPINGIDKNSIFEQFVRHLRESGKLPEIVNF